MLADETRDFGPSALSDFTDWFGSYSCCDELMGSPASRIWWKDGRNRGGHKTSIARRIWGVQQGKRVWKLVSTGRRSLNVLRKRGYPGLVRGSVAQRPGELIRRIHAKRPSDSSSHHRGLPVSGCGNCRYRSSGRLRSDCLQSDSPAYLQCYFSGNTRNLCCWTYACSMKTELVADGFQLCREISNT